MGIKISDLPSADPLSNTDIFPASQGSDTNGVTWAQMLAAFAAASDGTVVAGANYTALPASTSTITFSNTTGLIVGQPLRIIHTTEQVNKFYVITAINTNTQITVAGPPLVLGDAIEEIAILDSARVIQVELFAPGAFDFAGDTASLLARSTRSLFRWQSPRAKLVRASFSQGTVGTAAQPFVNVSIATAAVFTDNTNAGAQLSGTANTWVSIGAGTAASANYTVSFGDAIELILDAGINADSRDLSASLIFILE